MTSFGDDDAAAPVSAEEDAFYAAWERRILADDLRTPESAEAYEGEEARLAARRLLD
jgi:hypothetical protein